MKNTLKQVLDQCDASAVKRNQWIWWTFSLYYFVPAFYMPFDWGKHSVILAAYISFIILCYVVTAVDHSKAWRPIVALIILAIFTTNITSGSGTFFTYAGFFIGLCFTTRQFFTWLAGLVLIILALQFYHQYPIPYFLFPAITGVLTIGMVGIIERMRHETKLKELQSHHEIRQLAVIAERERIARDLHDILGHTLSSIALKAELAEKLLSQQKIAEGQQHLIELNKIARDSLSLVRQTVSGYKHRGLAGEVMQLCEQLRQNHFSVALTGEFPQLSARAETALILSLTELTTNILRHSKGNSCELSFRQACNKVIVTLSDNGKADAINEGNGLRGIRERLNALAGNLDINRQNSSAFTITLPVRDKNKDGYPEIVTTTGIVYS